MMYRVIEVDGWFRLLVVKTGTTTEAVFHTRQEADALCGQDFRDPEIQAAVRVLPMNRMHAFAIVLPWLGGGE